MRNRQRDGLVAVMGLGLLLGLLGWVDVAAAARDRDLVVTPKKGAQDSVSITGNYWALIIGIDQYQHAPKLESAVKDAKGVRDVLRERYGFQPGRITELFNEQATGANIQDALYQMGRQAGKDDSVLIYYAGHGQYDEDGKMGWWVPVEAKPKNPGTFITNASIRDYINGMKAKHVYLVADSCFSGTLFGSRALPPLNDQFFTKLYAHPSRWGLTSGGTEPVADRGKNGHSVFAYHLITLLRENTDPYLEPSHIYDQLAPLVANNTDQTPRSEPLKGAGDEGGQFVFRLASASGSLPQARPGTPTLSASAPSAGLSQAEQELQALEAQEQAVDAEAKQAEVQRKIEAKKQQIADKQKKLEVASLPSYSQPKELGRKIIGQDGAPMLLVPEGEFLYGDNNQRFSPSSFYMDKFEVSTAQYAKYMGTTGAQAPEYWPASVMVSHGQKPVVGVSWHEAEAYCRAYGKRLPTEQEWEKAARGTDGRTYPWGNEEPTSRHANFGKLNKDSNDAGFNNYRVLVNVGALEAGQSPYGLYHMAGNVWEWTSSDYDGNNKVIRGGSWLLSAVNLRATNRNWRSPVNWYSSIWGFVVPRTDRINPVAFIPVTL